MALASLEVQNFSCSAMGVPWVQAYAWGMSGLAHDGMLCEHMQSQRNTKVFAAQTGWDHTGALWSALQTPTHIHAQQSRSDEDSCDLPVHKPAHLHCGAAGS